MKIGTVGAELFVKSPAEHLHHVPVYVDRHYMEGLVVKKLKEVSSIYYLLYI
jgi:hypothetical protein